MLKVSSVKNLSNLFTPTEDVGVDLDSAISNANGDVFGVELVITKRGTFTHMVSPPHLRISEETTWKRTIPSEMVYYTGYLSEPFFLPIYRGLSGKLLDELENLPMKLVTGETVFIQLLFREVLDWKHKALSMYQSYLKGNDYPLPFRLGRVIQDKVLQVLNKVSFTSTTREYIEEAERKILSDGFQFQISIGVHSESRETVVKHIENILRNYDSYNAIRLSRMKGDTAERFVQECILQADSPLQILSRGELVSLLGGTDVEIVLDSEETSRTEEREQREQGSIHEESVTQLLPYTPREPDTYVPDNIVSNIADALKRVGLISAARVYNEKVIVGVRLTVVQFNIPKGRTITQIQSKQKDIGAALGVSSLGIEQGDLPDTVKLTVPNKEPTVVCLRELVEDERFSHFSKDNPLAFPVGVDEINNPIYLSLSKLVHLMVAGTTGSGKSVFLNSVAVTLMINNPPKELHMYMIDPKEVELQHYKKFPHVQEVVTDVGRAADTLDRLTKEMDERYKKLKEVGAKNIQVYNKKSKEIMPYIVCIIDEYADLKDTNPEVEEYIGRLGQKSRAAGIHLILATQRPSADIVSGRIKAVIPNAVSFNLNNNTNYRTVFGVGIPYSSLLGRGDGVMKIEGYHKEFQRFQSAIVSPDEVEEGRVLDSLADYFNSRYGDSSKTTKTLSSSLHRDVKTLSSSLQNKEEKETKGTKQSNDTKNQKDEDLYKLKQIIATTKETRVAPLREKLGIKTTTMSNLMGQLVEEGWLIKHKSKAKGYELIASDSTLDKWKSD